MKRDIDMDLILVLLGTSAGSAALLDGFIILLSLIMGAMVRLPKRNLSNFGLHLVFHLGAAFKILIRPPFP